jgi:hypothetical protein
MGPFVAVKPTPSTWVLLVTSPVAMALGVGLLVAEQFGWGALFLVAGLVNFGRSALVVWRFRQARSAPGHARPARTMSEAGSVPFVSDEVCWVPARLHNGLSFQPGWLVV